MAYKIYFDINVLLDLTLQRSNFNEVELIINDIENGFKKGFLTGATIHTLSYFLAKEYEQNKVKELLLNLLSIITVIDPPENIIKKALHANFKDIEDALQVYTALHFNMDIFITSDKKLKKETSTILPILSPLDYIKEFIK
jgi:predicted nucleic acid-binding protein